MLNSTGWNELIRVKSWEPPHFQPEKNLDGSGWEHEIEKQKQVIQEKKNALAHNKAVHPTGENAEPLQATFSKRETASTTDTVKIVDKSYLEKSFCADNANATQVIDLTVRTFSLNMEQERAFQIIANHAVSKNPEQLRMYLEGMGGTGKTQVIKALSAFFKARNEIDLS